ncbi:MAG: peptidoglycan DD-metalloendopeptidase family protein [Chloroflexota bacterium]|nr:peptidoglycan DD-metalloendopeptidase family protein [Chloroflexota bacterium]
MGAPRTDRGGGKSRWRPLVAALAGIAFLAVQVVPASADPGDQQRLADLAKQQQELQRAVDVSRANAERYRQQASTFQSAVDAANDRIATLAAQQDRAQNQADALKIQIEITEEQLALVAFQITETQSLIDALKAEGAAQQRELARRQDIYATHLRLTYLESRVSPLEMLLSSSSLSDFVTRVQDLVVIDRQDRQLVNEIQALQASTADKQQQVATDLKEIDGLQRQIEVQKSDLAQQKAQYDQLVAAAAASIDEQSVVGQQAASQRDAALGSKYQQDLQTNDLQKKLQEAQAAYEQLAADLAAKSGLAVWTGRLVNWPLGGVITQGFGPTPFWGEPAAWYNGVWYPHFHNGLDIAAPMYTPIRAPAAGRVVTVGKPYLAWGDTAEIVIIAHGGNFSTLYGHLDDSARPPVVSVGQWVRAGQLIGYVGMTGWTTGPHLHFMTIVDGHAQNPLSYLPPR